MANDGEADKGQSDLDFERECERDRRMNNRSRQPPLGSTELGLMSIRY